MSGDRLEEVLRTADASAPAPPLSDDLATRVRRRLTRRRRHRAAAAAVSIALIAGLTITIMFRRSQPQPALVALPPTTTPALAPAPAAPANDLAVVAAVHELTAEKLLAAAARRSSAASAASAALTPSAAFDVQFARDRAALMLVYDADRHVKENRPAAALHAYRRAAELFPRTHWGEIALRRLKEMQT